MAILREMQIIALAVAAVRASETSACFYKTARRWIPEGSHIHARRSENLKSNNCNMSLCICMNSPIFYMFHTVKNRRDEGDTEIKKQNVVSP